MLRLAAISHSSSRSATGIVQKSDFAFTTSQTNRTALGRNFATIKSTPSPTPSKSSKANPSVNSSATTEAEAREAIIKKIEAKIKDIAQQVESITPESQRADKRAALLDEVRAVAQSSPEANGEKKTLENTGADNRAERLRAANNDVQWIDRNTRSVLQRVHKADPTLLRDVLQRVSVDFAHRVSKVANLSPSTETKKSQTPAEAARSADETPILMSAARKATEDTLQAQVDWQRMRTLERDRILRPRVSLEEELEAEAAAEGRAKERIDRPPPPDFIESAAAPVPQPAPKGKRAPSQLSAEELTSRAEELINKAREAIDAEDWIAALPALEAATALRAQQLPVTSADVIQPHLTLAFVYQNLGRRELAAQLYEAWLPRMRTLHKDKADSGLAIAMLNYAELHGAFGRIAEAEKLAAEVVPMLQETLGEGEQLAGAMLNHAGFLAALGRVAEGLKHARAGLAMLEKALGSKNEYVASAVQNVLKMLHDLNRKDEIDPLVEEWRHKLNNPNFRLLTEEELAKVIPDDINVQQFVPEAAQQTVGKPLDPAGVIKPAGVYKREWEALWDTLHKKGLTSDPVMQRIVLEDLERVGHVSANESKDILRKREADAAAAIHAKISSLSDKDFDELHKAYRDTQKDNPDGEPGQVLGSMQI